VTRILIVVRDRRLGLLLEERLRAHGHGARVVTQPGTASAQVDYEVFDLVILDVALEGVEGFEMLRESCTGPAAPRAMLLNVASEDEAGALLNHARSLLDQPDRGDEPKLAVGEVELEAWNRRARIGDVDVALTDREFSLLRIFMRHPGRVMSREELHLHAWGHEYRLGSNAVEVYVGYLRKKLGPELIETVRGQGYRLPADSRHARQ
jgi:two-component system, OmpR family, copper resistance phosphate regulon response regulator CusR